VMSSSVTHGTSQPPGRLGGLLRISRYPRSGDPHGAEAHAIDDEVAAERERPGGGGRRRRPRLCGAPRRDEACHSHDTARHNLPARQPPTAHGAILHRTPAMASPTGGDAFLAPVARLAARPERRATPC